MQKNGSREPCHALFLVSFVVSTLGLIMVNVYTLTLKFTRFGDTTDNAKCMKQGDFGG